MAVRAAGGGVQPAIATATVETPSISVPMQSHGTRPFVKLKAPPLVEVATGVPSHEMGAAFSALFPWTVTVPADRVAS